MKELNLDVSWRIGEDSFEKIVNFLSVLKPAIIVEFGSGASSVRLALEFPEARILSIEHDREFYEETLSLARRFRVSNLDVSHRPLTWQQHGLALYKSYSHGDFPENIDAAVIDGPPYTAFRGREACLHQIWQRLRIRGQVVLDDYNRVSEQSYVKSWQQVYGASISSRIIQASHDLCLLTKESGGNSPVVHPGFLRNWKYAVANVIRR